MEDYLRNMGHSNFRGALKTEYGCQTNFLEMKSLRRRFNDMYKKRFRELDEAASHGKDEVQILKPRVQVLERYGEELDEQNNVLLSILEQTQQKMVETKEERDSKIQCLESQIETLEKQLHDTASKMDGKDGMIYDLKNEIADLKFHHMVKSGEAQRQEERIKSLQEELNKSHINAEKEMDTLRSNITNLKYRLEESNRQGAQWREEKSALETKLMEKEEIIKKCNEEYGKLEAKYQEKELEVQKQGKTIKRLQQEIEKGHQELNAANKKANKEIIAKRDDNIKKLEKEIKQLKVKNQIKKKQFQKQGETIRKLQAEVDKSHQKQDSVNRNSDNAVGVKETPESYATIKDEVSQLRYDIASCLEEYDKAHRGADEEIANKDDTIQKRTEGRGMKAMCPENVVILRQREAITMLQQEVSKSHQELDTANKNADKELDKLRDVIMSLEQDQEENNKKEEEMKEEINFLEEQRAASDAIVLKLNKEIDKLRAEEEFNKVQKEECISKLKQENSRIQKEVEKARKIANEELDKLRDVIMSLEKDQEENEKKEEEMKEEINFLEEQRAASDAMVLKLNKEIDKLRAEEKFNKVQKEECISKLKQENSRIQKEVEKAQKIADEKLEKLQGVIMTLEQDQEENEKEKEEMREEINFLEEQRAASNAMIWKLNKEIDKLRTEELNKVQKEESISKLKQENSRIQMEIEKARTIANEEVKLLVAGKEDMIQELNREIKKLKAENQEKLQEVHYHAQNFKELQVKFEKCQVDLDTALKNADKERKTLYGIISSVKQNLEESKKQEESQQDEIRLLEKKVNECDTTIQKLSSEIDKLKAENQELLGDNLIQKQGETIRKLQREVERSHQELSTANKNADKELSNRDEMINKLNIEIEKNHQELEAVYKTSKQELDTKCEIIRDLEQRLEESKKQGDGQQDEIYRLEDQVKKLNIELTSVQSKVDELQLLVAEKDDKIQYFKKGGHNLGAMNQKIALEAQKVLEMNAKLKETLANTQKDLDAAVQRINKKEELIEDFKKYTEGLRKQQSKDASKIAASDGMIQKLNSEISMLKTKYQEKALEAQIQQTTNKKIYERFSKWRLDVYNTAQ